MRICLCALGCVAVLLVGAGCDRLPDIGGEGQKCFGNGTCKDGLTCDPDTNTCQGECVADCTGKCGGASDGCGGTCSNDCDAGFYCEAAACLACEVAAHCGPACYSCAQQQNNMGCVSRDAGWECGCTGDGECAAGETCTIDAKTCTGQCTPRCDGLCGGAADSCGGTCDAACPSGESCRGEVCEDCLFADACGPACADCSGNITNLDCVDLGAGSFGCGCDGDEDCTSGEFCSALDCAPCEQVDHCGPDCLDCEGESSGHDCLGSGGDYFCGCQSDPDCPAGSTCNVVTQLCEPEALAPLHALDLSDQDCTVMDLDMSGSFDPHYDMALLVACGTISNTERLWFLGGALEPNLPYASWGPPANADSVSSVEFSSTGYDILSAYNGGQWQLRSQSGAAWGMPTDLDGGTEMVYDARYSPDGTKVVTLQGQGMGMGGGFKIWNADFSDPIGPISTNGYAAMAGFTADSARVAAGAAAMMQDTGGMMTVRASDGGDRVDGPVNINIYQVAFPAFHDATRAFATISTPFNGGSESVTLWDISSGIDIVGVLNVQVAGAQSLAVLPEQGDNPSQVVLVGKADGLVVAYQITGGSMGLKLTPELSADCGIVPIRFMRLSPAGDLLATACGSKIHIWETSALRAFFPPL